MIKPNQQCLIVCSKKDSAFAGLECKTINFIGRAPACNVNTGVITVAHDFWEVDVKDRPAPPEWKKPWLMRAAWLVPLDGNQSKQFQDDEVVDNIEATRAAFKALMERPITATEAARRLGYRKS